MWAVSFLTFLANPLVGMVLLMSAAITTGIKAVKVDAEFAKRGELPPTARLVDKWLDNRKAAGKAPADAKPKKYGSWAYAWQRWYAMWEDLGEQHREAREQHKAAVAEAKKNGTPVPAKPPLKKKLTGWKWNLPGLGGAKPDPENTQPEPAGSTSTLFWSCDKCGTGCGGYESDDEADKDAQEHIDTVHGGRGQVVNHSVHIPAAADENVPSPAPQPAPTPAAVAPCNTCGGTDTMRGDMTRCLYCIALNATPGDPKREGEPMPDAPTQQSGEVTGIPSAINYLTQMAAAHAQHADNEPMVARLAGFKVGAGDLALVQVAMAASQNAADLYTTAATTLTQSNAGVREAFAAAPNAADKTAQMAE